MSVDAISRITSALFNFSDIAAHQAGVAKPTLTEEAAQGDPEAVRQLTKEHEQQESPAPESQPGVGRVIDILA